MPYTKPMDKRRKYSKRKSRRSGSRSSKRSKSSAASTKEMREIAKKVVDKQTPVKWFETVVHEDIAVNPIQQLAAQFCLGFSALSNVRREALPGSSANLYYGTELSSLPVGSPTLQVMKTLGHGRIFAESESNATLKLNRPDSQSIHPNVCESRFLIERRLIDSDTDIPSEALPMFVRLLHIECKNSVGGQAVFDPRTDAFVNAYGQPCGISSSGWNKTTLALLKTNKDKYTVHQDMNFQLLPPLIEEETNGDGINPYPAFPSSKSKKIITLKHNIGTTLKYSPGLPTTGRGDSDRFPISGQKQSFVLMHFQFMGDVSTIRNSAGCVRVSVIPTSTFRD